MAAPRFTFSNAIFFHKRTSNRSSSSERMVHNPVLFPAVKKVDCEDPPRFMWRNFSLLFSDPVLLLLFTPFTGYNRHPGCLSESGALICAPVSLAIPFPDPSGIFPSVLDRIIGGNPWSTSDSFQAAFVLSSSLLGKVPPHRLLPFPLETLRRAWIQFYIGQM